MKRALINTLCCPMCGAPLEFVTSAEDDITTGLLQCTGCSRRYPIVRGIPRLLPEDVTARVEATAAAFGYEWQHYPRDNPYSVEQFLDWIAPIQPDFFRDKVVLDAGCGTGGFSAYAADFGARKVVALDISDSVEVARRHAVNHDNLDIVQGSIDRPPLTAAFDFIFSIGVIHHLESPAAGIASLARLLRPGGTLFIWVYGHENNGVLLAILLPLRRIVRRFPYRLLKWLLALPLAVILYPILRTLYLAPPDKRRLPYAAYFHWLSQYDFAYVHGVILDQLIAPTAFYLRRDEVEAAVHAAGLSDVRLTQRNGNSWRASGVRPVPTVARATEAPARL